MAEATKREGRVELARFTRIVEAYGGKPEAWPEDERDQAVQLMRRDPAAAAMVERALALDALLDAAPGHEPTHALRARVMAEGARTRPTWSQRLDRWAAGLWPLGRSWQPMAALAAAAALGLATGLFVPSNDAEAEPYGVTELSLEDFGDIGEAP